MLGVPLKLPESNSHCQLCQILKTTAQAMLAKVKGLNLPHIWQDVLLVVLWNMKYVQSDIIQASADKALRILLM